MVSVEAISDPRDLVDQFAEIYHSALSTLDDSTDLTAAYDWARSVLPRHATREAFRCFGAFDDDTLIGFIYGYHGATGQYWEDWLAQRVPPDVYEEWIGDHFALVEFHVTAEHHGQGVGTRLYDALFGVPLGYRCAVLTTRNGDTPARRFYEKRGWRLVRQVTERHSLMGLEPVAVLRPRQASD